MRKLLVALGIAAGCSGDDGPSDPHDEVQCAAAPNWGTGSSHIERCELGCVAEPTYPGPSCSMAACPSGDCHGASSCSATFTTADGFVGCCTVGGAIATGVIVRFLECE